MSTCIAVLLNEFNNNVRHLEAINALRKELSGGRTEINLSQLADTIRHSRFWVVLDDQQTVVAMATLVPAYTLDRVDGYVEAVVVAKSCRRQGLGKQLMKAIFEDARRLKMRHLHLTARQSRRPAHQFYMSLGFMPRDGVSAYRLNV